MTDELKPTIKERAIRAVRDLVVSLEQMDEVELANIRATPQAALLREWIAKGERHPDPDAIKREARREALEAAAWWAENRKAGIHLSEAEKALCYEHAEKIAAAIRALSEGTNHD